MNRKQQLRAAERELAASDPVMAQLIRRHGPCDRLRRHSQPAFHALVRAIISQQLSTKAANSIEQKLKTLLGLRQFRAQALLLLSDAQFRACGFSAGKIRYVRGVAAAHLNGELSFRRLSRQDDATAMAALVALPGVGRWTAEMVLMFGMGRLDIFAPGDLALRRSMENLYTIAVDSDFSVYEQKALDWVPYRSVASWYLWAALREARGEAQEK